MTIVIQQLAQQISPYPICEVGHIIRKYYERWMIVRSELDKSHFLYDENTDGSALDEIYDQLIADLGKHLDIGEAVVRALDSHFEGIWVWKYEAT